MLKESRRGYGKAGGCFADVIPHSSRSYHQEHMSLAGQSTARSVACGSVPLRFHAVSNLWKVLVCNL
jgi:hypothetical protein